VSTPAPRPPGPHGIHFGQVWESLDEAIGPMRYLVVSSDAYNTAFGDRRVIAVEIDSRAVYHGAYREPIPDAGTAHLDRLTWVTRRQLTELVGELHPDRHAPVTTIIRELIGNT
jgi:mRNA-degrading endonuclease toxin of MazEF toxin-antitoxin module